MSPCCKGPDQITHIINVATKVQKDGVGQLGSVNEIVLSKAVAIQDGGVNIDDHISVVRP